ncbi:MAG: CRISPR-associated endonuclease Cas2 [Victivallaceae bacterium]|nr:CRISPR-associated endonuclease Cas2 [Victivallaceae bacterium]MDD5663612.1 CRISPR-associated endonuclease Cas2 [Victivallaceae bacterium]
MPNSSSCHDPQIYASCLDSVYFIGQTVSFDPAKEVYKNMLRLVAYDIADSSRLRKVANLCENYGIRIEYSVFECDLDDSQFVAFWEQLHDLINEKEDKIIAYRICAGCVSCINSAGIVCRPGKVLIYVI